MPLRSIGSKAESVWLARSLPSLNASRLCWFRTLASAHPPLGRGAVSLSDVSRIHCSIEAPAKTSAFLLLVINTVVLVIGLAGPKKW